ncbi:MULTISPECIES: hypothetical protein [unclassified Methylobacterium]|jgi:hypothetical protein|uniref:hypothetical protein n=1 Tax=unclassified Methylobacterium TaxID=2615210 RepID=UPI001D0CBF2C|nr:MULTISPECIES: hypothetical protein [unclassified Methylobacterium]
MLHAAMQAAIEGARTFAQMDELGRQLWQGHGAGALSDGEAQTLAERLHGRRNAIRDGIRPLPIPGLPSPRVSLFPPRRNQVTPDRRASRDRRRLLAASSPLPPALATRFTTGQIAVLRIVADEVSAKDVCGLCIDAIAARAGVCRRLAQGAIRLAEGDGLLTVEERRHQGRKNSPNLVRIINRDWQSWMRRGRRGTRHDCTEAGSQPQRIGCRSIHPTDTGLLILGKTEAIGSLAVLPRKQVHRPGTAVSVLMAVRTDAEPPM